MEQAGVLILAVILSALAFGVVSGVIGSVLAWMGLPLKSIVLLIVGTSVAIAIGWAVASAYEDPIFGSFWEALRVNGVIATMLWGLYIIPNIIIVFISVLLKRFFKKNNATK